VPRAPRIEYPNAIHHITQRGNRRDAIFVTPADYRVYLAILADVARRFKWQVLSYCLMPNHLHLLLQTPAPNLAQGMQHLSGGHSKGTSRAERGQAEARPRRRHAWVS
jgi:putative transposase